MSRWLSPATSVAVGVGVMGGGLGLMALAYPGPDALLVMSASMVVFAAGRALAEPAKDVVVAALAPAGSLAAFFGVAFLALAVGGSTGNYLGGWLYDVATLTGWHSLPWLIFASFGVLVALGLLRFARSAGASVAGVVRVRGHE